VEVEAIIEGDKRHNGGTFYWEPHFVDKEERLLILREREEKRRKNKKPKKKKTSRTKKNHQPAGWGGGSGQGSNCSDCPLWERIDKTKGNTAKNL